jgi:hypothetical protein
VDEYRYGDIRDQDGNPKSFSLRLDSISGLKLNLYLLHNIG